MELFVGVVLEPTEEGFRAVHFEPRIEAANPLDASNQVVQNAQLDLARAILVPATRGLATKEQRRRLTEVALKAIDEAGPPPFVRSRLAKHFLYAVRRRGGHDGRYLVAVAPHKKP